MRPQKNGPDSGTAAPRLSIEPSERRAISALAAIYAVRMLGLFLLLPVLALYARGLPGATPVVVGLAMGAYGLTQAILQIPFGLASDRLGRRPVILVGLVLYAAGSLIGALATGIWGIVAARMVQGAGAVSGPVSALLADLTRPEVRTRAMAFIGASIGASFIVSLIAAPLLEPLVGVVGIFWTMMGLAGLSIVLLYTVVPQAAPDSAPAPSREGRLKDACSLALAPYYLGIFALNFVLTATFVGVPIALRDVLAIATQQHWQTYVGVFGASVLPTVGLVLATERSGAAAGLLRASIVLLAVSLGGLALGYHQYWVLFALLAAFFTAFNYLEARLPARLSQVAPAAVRGAALSIFATMQFLGAFCGGLAAGALLGTPFGIGAVFTGSAVLAVIWFGLHREASR